MAQQQEMNEKADTISEAFRILISEKHLYQHVAVNPETFKRIAARHHKIAQGARRPTAPGATRPVVEPLLEQFVKTERRIIDSGRWTMDGDTGNVFISPPTIRTFCTQCQRREPFNPVVTSQSTAESRVFEQWFVLTYQCQGCKSEPHRFLVHRVGDKLTLCGRSPIEFIDVPKVIPKAMEQHYSDAVLALNCGKPLMGIFKLRVLIEQYWKGLPFVAEAVKERARPTGDDLGSAYKESLPPDFKDRFPNLLETYDLLSEAIHSASEDPAVFERCRDQIIEHFEARKLFRMK